MKIRWQLSTRGSVLLCMRSTLPPRVSLVLLLTTRLVVWFLGWVSNIFIAKSTIVWFELVPIYRFGNLTEDDCSTKITILWFEVYNSLQIQIFLIFRFGNSMKGVYLKIPMWSIPLTSTFPGHTSAMTQERWESNINIIEKTLCKTLRVFPRKDVEDPPRRN